MSDDIIIAAIRQRLKAKQTDLNGGLRQRLTTITPVNIASDEKRLGFRLPPLLARLYAEIANGGFGPGYGLIGLTNGAPDEDIGDTAPAIYESFRRASTDEPSWNWPEGLLPICQWGCAIRSCVNCTDRNFRMQIFDPNVHEGLDWSDCFFEESASFTQWIEAWASGADLWGMMYGPDGRVTRALSSRRTAH
ncbi:SMI1/KNR4 family protein [Bradyrhizobium quebecense]|uniref:SMI1/KNR4 family protein n=2 Tax=Bradyrhizobium quebecense TaxID=2748629 RepID=A0ACD3VEY6_9BRAD|nr:SMI1/KNR4 family protein [Bradyrhizobium quebecense]UGY05034.1 SMI1/KNR4 family protein [Bradyrhizobium quebecense]